MEQPRVKKYEESRPKHIKDDDLEKIDQWKQYCRIKKEIQEHPRRFIEIKHPDTEGDTMWIDLVKPRPFVNKSIRHLPDKEKKQILELVTYFARLKGKLGGLSRKINSINPVKYNTGKNTEPYIPYIIEFCGQWKTNEEVVKEVYKQHEYSITTRKVAEVRMSHKDEITKLQNEWAAKYEDMDIAKKRGRLERLAYLIATNTDEYKKDNKYSIERSKEIRALIEQVRKEVEGEKLSVDINGNINITATMNLNLSLQVLSSKVSVNSFIIALVAMKRGIDPMKLQNELMTSYYQNYAGYKQINHGQFQKKYPSNLINTYDWDVIAKVHENDEKEEDQPIEEAIIVEETPTQIDIKKKLLDMIASKKEEFKNGIK
jgi:hypothetical protein